MVGEPLSQPGHHDNDDDDEDDDEEEDDDDADFQVWSKHWDCLPAC